MALHVVILAAGQGTRMHSKRPKVLHHLGGKPMVMRVVETALTLKPAKIHLVVGKKADSIKQTLAQYPIHWVYQEEPLGTGHALLQCLPHLSSSDEVLVLYADTPLVQTETLQKLLETAASSSSQGLGLLLAKLPNPTGLGRILRDSDQQILAIVEEKDATSEQKKINEIFTGICCVPTRQLQQWLPQLSCDNAQKEYYLTDIIALAHKEHCPIFSLPAENFLEVQGVNNAYQLYELERVLQKRLTTQLMLSGVTLLDATRVDIRGQLQCGKDVIIDVNTIFEGNVVLGDDCVIEPHCILKNVTLGKNCRILASSVLEDCHIGDNCHIGPFARLRPGTKLAEHCKIGNFVEVKNTQFAQGSKANHLSYIGDATVGQQVNIGAGTITCNYDGAHKHPTHIEDGVFIGSATQLIAPISIGKNATIGAGSTLRKDVPAGELTYTEAKQKTVYGWKRPKK